MDEKVTLIKLLAITTFYNVSGICEHVNNSLSLLWKSTKKVLKYLQSIACFMLTYKQFDIFDMVEYSDIDYVGNLYKKIYFSLYLCW